MTGWTDIVNAIFEGSAFFWVGLNCLDIWKKKMVAGQTIAANLSFSAWGAWNIFYYPSLGQWFSSAAGIGVMLANLVCFALVLRYRQRPARPTEVSGAAIEATRWREA